MATYGAEDIPGTWDDVRDTAFFRITASLFSTDFTYGASILLASYDDVYEALTLAADLPIPAKSTPLDVHQSGREPGVGALRD